MRRSLWLLSLMAWAPVAQAQTPVSLLPGNLPAAFQLNRPDASYAYSRLVAVAGQPFPTALEVTTVKATANPWDIQLVVPTTAPVAAGDVLLASFFARRRAPDTSPAYVTLILEQSSTPWGKSVERIHTLGNAEWTQVHVAFTAAGDYPTGGAQLTLRLGYTPQTIQVAGVTLTNYYKSVAVADLPNTLTYAGREPDASWRAPAAARIDQLRKNNLRVLVTDHRGQPVPGATVRVSMQRHAFGFGTAVDAATLLGQSADTDKYRAAFLQLFNRGTIENDLKWPNYETNPVLGPAAVDWLRSRGIPVRGHNLLWPAWQWLPPDLPGLANDPTALRSRIQDHLTRIVSDLRGRLSEWDVLNEPFSSHDLTDILGMDEIGDWFRQTRATDPSAVLVLNDYDLLEGVGTNTAHQNFVANLLHDLRAKDVPVDALGLQGHFSLFLAPPEQLLQLLDRYAALGVRLQATEFDINIRDEMVQADYLRDFMTVLFSHPAVDNITQWGFWQSRHWLPDAALLRKDWSFKPSAHAYTNLVFGQWWTETNTLTGADGICELRAFKGDYQLQATINGVTGALQSPLLSDTTLTLILTNALPTLEARRQGGQLLLSWATNHANFRLQQTPASTPAGWTTVEDQPASKDGWFEVTRSPGSAHYFYRLERAP